MTVGPSGGTVAFRDGHRLSLGSRSAGVAFYVALCAFATALFLAAPGLDIAVSGLFYDPQHGFFLAEWRPIRDLERTIPRLTELIVVIVFVGAAWLFLMRRKLWRLDRKALLFVAVATALGPGLIANSILKDHWGRARPSQIEMFGGTKQFTPAPLSATQCDRNCSFVSGHASLGFALVVFAMLLPPGRRRIYGQIGALGFGALVGLGRIAQGGHFLSDVVFAGLLVYGTSWLLHVWIVEHDGLARPAALRLYRAGGGLAADLWRSPAGRLAIFLVVVAAIEAVAVQRIDEPLAIYLHARDGDLHALADLTSRLGLGYPYLVVFGLAYAGMRWGGGLPGLRPWAASLRAAAGIPAFLFAAIAVSGLVVDLAKVLIGRTRPKLLFASGVDAFTGIAWRPDHWSFPSGHTATIAALAAALWLLWPRHLMFYVLLAVVVAASRIVVGAHYLSDTVIGASVAILVTLGAARLFVRWNLVPLLDRGGAPPPAALRPPPLAP